MGIGNGSESTESNRVKAAAEVVAEDLIEGIGFATERDRRKMVELVAKLIGLIDPAGMASLVGLIGLVFPMGVKIAAPPPIDMDSQ